ncbi:hypothetical protein AX17_004665 [Amanita inopinata Kibby_2008]|nr:hypothetical protein AX17_004665 [Amanita inopinata Kibby_2008]
MLLFAKPSNTSAITSSFMTPNDTLWTPQMSRVTPTRPSATCATTRSEDFSMNLNKGMHNMSLNRAESTTRSSAKAYANPYQTFSFTKRQKFQKLRKRVSTVVEDDGYIPASIQLPGLLSKSKVARSIAAAIQRKAETLRKSNKSRGLTREPKLNWMEIRAIETKVAKSEGVALPEGESESIRAQISAEQMKRDWKRSFNVPQVIMPGAPIKTSQSEMNDGDTDAGDTDNGDTEDEGDTDADDDKENVPTFSTPRAESQISHEESVPMAKRQTYNVGATPVMRRQLPNIEEVEDEDEIPRTPTTSGTARTGTNPPPIRPIFEGVHTPEPSSTMEPQTFVPEFRPQMTDTGAYTSAPENNNPFAILQHAEAKDAPEQIQFSNSNSNTRPTFVQQEADRPAFSTPSGNTQVAGQSNFSFPVIQSQQEQQQLPAFTFPASEAPWPTPNATFEQREAMPIPSVSNNGFNGAPLGSSAAVVQPQAIPQVYSYPLAPFPAFTDFSMPPPNPTLLTMNDFYPQVNWMSTDLHAMSRSALYGKDGIRLPEKHVATASPPRPFAIQPTSHQTTWWGGIMDRSNQCKRKRYDPWQYTVSRECTKASDCSKRRFRYALPQPMRSLDSMRACSEPKKPCRFPPKGSEEDLILRLRHAERKAKKKRVRFALDEPETKRIRAHSYAEPLWETPIRTQDESQVPPHVAVDADMFIPGAYDDHLQVSTLTKSDKARWCPSIASFLGSIKSLWGWSAEDEEEENPV